ncbi:MAG: succinate dehydrogenase, cytochrome b556 subunit [Thermotogae bacterium]|nr:succinate dehydrogenase, cytochrome b556 subunit [Thermotogota bacterium]
MYNRRKGFIRWVFGGKYNLEAYLFLLHRITGIALAFYLPLHIIVTSMRIFGPETWKATMERVAHNPIAHIGEWLLVVAVAVHGLNGLRLIFTELGMFIGRPSRPIYPYRNSIDRQRVLSWAVMVLSAVFIVWSLFAFSPKLFH